MSRYSLFSTSYNHRIISRIIIIFIFTIILIITCIYCYSYINSHQYLLNKFQTPTIISFPTPTPLPTLTNQQKQLLFDQLKNYQEQGLPEEALKELEQQLNN